MVLISAFHFHNSHIIFGFLPVYPLEELPTGMCYDMQMGWVIVQWSIVRGVGLEYKYSSFDLDFGGLARRNTPFQRDITEWAVPLYFSDSDQKWIGPTIWYIGCIRIGYDVV
jgi:hypothetical protein